MQSKQFTTFFVSLFSVLVFLFTYNLIFYTIPNLFISILNKDKTSSNEYTSIITNNYNYSFVDMSFTVDLERYYIDRIKK